MDSIAFYRDISDSRIETLRFNDALFLAINRIYHIGCSPVPREGIKSMTCLLIRGEIEFDIGMRKATGRKARCAFHKDRHACFIISTKKRIP